MGFTDSREIRRELDELKPWLEAYVAQAIGAGALERLLAGSDGPARKADIQKLIRVMLDQWDAVFRSRLRPIVRTYLHEVLDIRNRWAHEEPFSLDDNAHRGKRPYEARPSYGRRQT